MTGRLFDRQANLLAYLTSAAVIFADRDAPRGVGTEGIDHGLLCLEARFSHQKRMVKIAGVFPRTFRILGSDFDRIVRAFVENCPPAEIGRLANAHQFHGFLTAHPRHRGAAPPYLLDVAACELACAEARNWAEAFDPAAWYENSAAGPRTMRGGSIRRHPAVRLLRCRHDIRTMFGPGGDDEGADVPPERDTPLAIVFPADAEHLQVFELLPVVFELLLTLEDWTDPAAFGIAPALDDLVRQLGASGLIEVRQ
jgi:hypothetical protein